MKNQNKAVYQPVPEGSNRQSQPYEKAKAAEMPESCGRQLRAWLKIFFSPLAGEEARRAGEGYQKENTYTSPSSGLCPPFPSVGRRVNGFTLIELLVVVLIIGILAAVALPQYQKAVWKSKNVQLKVLVKNVVEAQQRYYLANGEYAKDFTDLDVSLPITRSSELTKGPCLGTTTGGTDSVRYADDFQIFLTESQVVASWRKTPYQCGGFSAPYATGKLRCTERYLMNPAYAPGAFCEKVEQAAFSSQPTTWRYYRLP